MKSVEIPGQPSPPPQTEDHPPPTAGARRVPDDPAPGIAAPHYVAVFHFHDGRSAELVIPGVTGMSGGGDADGPGRLSVYAPPAGEDRGTRRLLEARLFNDLAELAVVAEPLELDIDEVPESGR